MSMMENVVKECTQVRAIWLTIAIVVGGIVSVGTWLGDMQWMPRAQANEQHREMMQQMQRGRYEDRIFQLRSAISDLEIQLGVTKDIDDRQMLGARVKVKEGQIKATQDKIRYRGY